MYTEIFVNVDLREDTPPDVIAAIKAMCEKNGDSPLLQDKPDRWGYMFNDGSFYTPQTECGKLTWNDISNQWSLIAKGDIKNYESEIEAFFAWLMPYVDGEEGEFVGYSRYEESLTPELIFLSNNEVSGAEHPSAPTG